MNEIYGKFLLDVPTNEIFTEAVFAGGKEKVKPVEETFQKLKDELEAEVAKQENSPGSSKDQFNPEVYWKNPLWKELEDKMKDAFGFRTVMVNPYIEKYNTKNKEFQSKCLNAWVYNLDRYPIDGLVTDNGFYDKTHSVQMDIYITPGLIRALDADELLGVLLHEFGHGIDPALVDISYSDVNILSKYMTDRTKKITDGEKKAAKRHGVIPGLLILIMYILGLYLLPAIDALLEHLPLGNKGFENKLNKLKDKVKKEQEFNRKDFSEAYADNFARMYGYGPALMRGLKKLDKYYDDKRNKSRFQTESSRRREILNMTRCLMQDEHKTDMHRAHALVKEYKADLEDPNTPDAVKKQIQADLDELEAVIKTYTEDFSDAQNRVNKAIYQALEEKDEEESKKSSNNQEKKNLNEKGDSDDMNGLFDLHLFENAEDDDILNVKINESNEFDYKCPSNHPEEHFDAANSGNRGPSVPGGLNEKPSARPEGGEYGPSVPGGLTEKPSAKPDGGEHGPGASGKVTLDSNTYNQALEDLKKSFKECYDLFETITNVNVIPESVEQRQDEFLEDAILAAYENGPLFEAVDRKDKDEVKAIVQKIRDGVSKALKSKGYDFRNIKGILRVLGGDITALGGVATKGAVWFRTRIWQTIGLTYVEDGNAKELCDNLTEKFKEELGDYKILPLEVDTTLIDWIINKINWKHQKNSYLLVVDKKVPKFD